MLSRICIWALQDSLGPVHDGLSSLTLGPVQESVGSPTLSETTPPPPVFRPQVSCPFILLHLLCPGTRLRLPPLPGVLAPPPPPWVGGDSFYISLISPSLPGSHWYRAPNCSHQAALQCGNLSTDFFITDYSSRIRLLLTLPPSRPTTARYPSLLFFPLSFVVSACSSCLYLRWPSAGCGTPFPSGRGGAYY